MRRQCRPFPIRYRPTTIAARRTTISPKRCASGRTVLPASPRCRCRSRSGRRGNWNAASPNSASAARWSTASRKIGDADTALYYDLPQYRPFWATVLEKLDVPFYLHPRNPLPRDSKIYDGHPWLLGPVWAFGQETAVHRAAADGLGIVRHPPAAADHSRPHGRVPCRSRCGALTTPMPGSRTATTTPPSGGMREYFSANFNVTTSGNSTPRRCSPPSPKSASSA